ncbi:hypothetical protein WA158_008253 [Blastocystis sp. Blastoise]
MENKYVWPTNPESYELLGEVGSGAFARVYKAICKENNEIVAVKILNLEASNSNFEDIRREVSAMKSCDHPNILPLYCCFNAFRELWIVTPYMDKGSFLRIIMHLKNHRMIAQHEGLAETYVAIILKEVAKGLAYLHDHGIIHRDIKAGNILINKDCHIYLGDLGVARALEGPGGRRNKAQTYVGTPCWMAPEVLLKETYEYPVDVWSLGITALELYKSYPPYAKLDSIVILQHLTNPDKPAPGFDDYPRDTNQKPSNDFKKFLSLCLVKDPSKRADVSQLLTCNFLANAPDVSELHTLIDSIPEMKQNTEFKPLPKTVDVKFAPGTTWDFTTETTDDTPIDFSAIGNDEA